ncbi:MAG: class I SAM-dependent methyltransferase [Chloroflexi bacterium]|nr:class I SAM-dependent methyltransferase [Chloroflexota bacterium]
MATDGDWQYGDNAGKTLEEVQALWHSRAGLGDQAGTYDLLLHQLEITAIAKYIEDGTTILDVGCGNGATLTALAPRFPKCIFAGVDYSKAMIEAARSRIWNRPCFFYGSVLEPKQLADITGIFGQFDMVFTKRCLINLASWEEQKQAIRNICALLKPGGLYVMCEASQDGLDEINGLRASVKLPAIIPPWHNRYLLDNKIVALRMDLAGAVHCIFGPPFTSTYYYLSRVVNAKLAADEGREPDYDAPINKLALQLPPLGALRGQTRIWTWKRLR